MFKYIFTILLLLSAVIYSQEKYFIYFHDKGISSEKVINKSNKVYLEALQKLSSKAIDRRMKNMGQDFISYEDFPLYQVYLDSLEKLNVKIIHKLSWFNSVSALLSADQIEKIKTLPFVEKIVPVKKLYFSDEVESSINQKLSVSDTSYNYGQSLAQLNLSDIPFVLSKNIDGKNVLIGVLDSGFDWNRHESLKNRNVIDEYDFVFDDSVTANQSEDVASQDNHGTYVFSVLAGFKDSVMISPAFNSSFLLAKTEDVRTETNIEEDNYAAALIWMESKGVDITTSSLGYNIFDTGNSYTYSDMNGITTIVTKAAELAFQRGVATFTSAGNEGNNSWKYIIAPADGFNIIAVGAVDASKNLASFSSIGPTSDGRIKPEVVAMGVNVFGAAAGTLNSYRVASGTSSAAPIACGVGALLLSAHPHLKNTQIRNILLVTSSNSIDPNNQIGYGLISAKKAIEFPNLKLSSSIYVLHKIIFEDRVIPQSVRIISASGDVIYFNNIMNKSGDYIYTFNIPQMVAGESVGFYITYSDSLNNNYRSPENGNYSFIYGSDIISLNPEPVIPLPNYEVSDFYPNPFIPANHKQVKINYYASESEIFKVAIFDCTGKKILESESIAKKGINSFNWNGFSDRGYVCASGVYIALVQFNGKEYGKKFVLLK